MSWAQCVCDNLSAVLELKLKTDFVSHYDPCGWLEYLSIFFGGDERCVIKMTMKHSSCFKKF